MIEPGQSLTLAETHNDTLSMQFAYLRAAEARQARKSER